MYGTRPQTLKTYNINTSLSLMFKYGKGLVYETCTTPDFQSVPPVYIILTPVIGYGNYRKEV